MKKMVIVLCMVVAGTVIVAVASDPAERYMAKFKSSDANAQYEAVDYFEHMAAKTGLAIPADLSRTDLEAYLKRWAGNSDNAALLLGRLGRKESIALLKEQMAEAEEIERKADDMDHRNALAPKVRLACLKALVRLRDEKAMQDVRSLLQSNRVEDRARGIECISFANDRTLILDLVPLLDDKRDAVNIAPTGASYYLRICDLAVDAVAEIGEVRTSFTVQRGARYSDEQIAEVRGVFNRLK
jgi:hypothetical protein